ncbi:MAG: glycosyltransferase family 4 protein, partial [Candidatus Latescibacterota bacterium]
VRKYLQRALVLVNTSRVEGFPNAYLEAWSHRVPVVTFNDVDGMIEDHQLGVVCDGMDGMEEALRSVLADTDARQRAGDRARQYVADRFSKSALGRQYSDFFEELAAKRRSR